MHEKEKKGGVAGLRAEHCFPGGTFADGSGGVSGRGKTGIWRAWHGAACMGCSEKGKESAGEDLGQINEAVFIDSNAQADIGISGGHDILSMAG